jgi:heme oxygenase
MDTPSLTLTLRQATQAQHQAVEALPFSHALLAQRLPLSAYQAQLAAYYPLWRTLERACATLPPPLDAVWSHNMCRSAYLEADLRFFKHWPPPQLSQAHAFITQLHYFQAHKPAALLGCVYVFEGSMLGSQLLLPLIQQSYHLQDDGCRYYASWMNYSPHHWKQFKQRLDDCAHTGADIDAIVDGASSTFIAIQQILNALLPT